MKENKYIRPVAQKFFWLSVIKNHCGVEFLKHRGAVKKAPTLILTRVYFWLQV